MQHQSSSDIDDDDDIQAILKQRKARQSSDPPETIPLPPNDPNDFPDPLRRLLDGLDPPQPNTGRGFRPRPPAGEYVKLNGGKTRRKANFTQIDSTGLGDDLSIYFALAIGDGDDPRTVKEALESHDAEQ
jgi:hypothetical protein